jgi:thiol:disulfide interchange protein
MVTTFLDLLALGLLLLALAVWLWPVIGTAWTLALVGVIVGLVSYAIDRRNQ